MSDVDLAALIAAIPLPFSPSIQTSRSPPVFVRTAEAPRAPHRTRSPFKPRPLDVSNADKILNSRLVQEQNVDIDVRMHDNDLSDGDRREARDCVQRTDGKSNGRAVQGSNEWQQMIEYMEEKEALIAELEEALYAQSEEFSRRMGEQQKELQAAKDRECVVHARAEAHARQREEVLRQLEEVEQRHKDNVAELDKVRQLHVEKVVDTRKLRSELAECEQRNAGLQLAENTTRDAQQEVVSLKETIAAKDRTIAQFKEERLHRPKKRDDYVRALDQREVLTCATQTETRESGAVSKDLIAAEKEVTALRARVADAERMLRDASQTDGLSLKREVDSLRAELLAASTSERDAQQLACSVLDELKEARLAIDALENEKHGDTQEITAINDHVVATYKEENSALQSQVSSLQKQLANHDSDVSRLRDKLQELADSNNTLNGTNASLVQQLARADSEARQVSRTSDTLRRDAENASSLRNQMARMEKEKQALESKCAQAEAQADQQHRLLREAQEDAAALKSQCRVEEEKAEKLRADSSMLHKEKSEIAGARRDLEVKMDDLRWQVKVRDLEKLKTGEDKERELTDLRKEIEALRKKQADRKDAKLLDASKSENRALEEKVKTLEQEKARTEEMRQQFAQEVTILRKSLQEQHSNADDEEIRRNTKHLERGRTDDAEEHVHVLNSLKRRISHLESQSRASSAHSLAMRSSTPHRVSVEYDASPRPKVRTKDRERSSSPMRWPARNVWNDVTHSGATRKSLDSGRREKNREGSPQSRRIPSRGRDSFRDSRAEATMLGYWDSDSETSLERLVIESDPLRRASRD